MPVSASSIADNKLVLPAPFGPCISTTGASSDTVTSPRMLRKSLALTVFNLEFTGRPQD